MFSFFFGGGGFGLLLALGVDKLGGQCWLNFVGFMGDSESLRRLGLLYILIIDARGRALGMVQMDIPFVQGYSMACMMCLLVRETSWGVH